MRGHTQHKLTFGSTGLGADCLTLQVSHSVGSTFSSVITVTAKPVGRTTKHKKPTALWNQLQDFCKTNDTDEIVNSMTYPVVVVAATSFPLMTSCVHRLAVSAPVVNVNFPPQMPFSHSNKWVPFCQLHGAYNPTNTWILFSLYCNSHTASNAVWSRLLDWFLLCSEVSDRQSPSGVW